MSESIATLACEFVQRHGRELVWQPAFDSWCQALRLSEAERHEALVTVLRLRNFPAKRLRAGARAGR